MGTRIRQWVSVESSLFVSLVQVGGMVSFAVVFIDQNSV